MKELASKANELRLYQDLVNSISPARYIQGYMGVRKAILLQRGITNFAGLSTDKINFSFEEWTSIVNKLFNSYGNALQQILGQFQVTLEKLCKLNSGLKQLKENFNKVSMTTLIETVLITTESLEKHFDSQGKHLVEERLTQKAEKEKGKSENHNGKHDPARSTVHGSESPLKLITKYVDEHSSGEKPRSDKDGPRPATAKNDHLRKSSNMQQDGKQTVKSVNSRPLVKNEDTDPYLDKIKEKKMMLAQELRATEEERLKQSKEVIKSLAELNIMNKELRSLNHHYFEVSKKFENIFRRYMQKYGRTKISNSDLNMFNKITKEKKTVDYSAKVNATLKNPFIRFMRSNFSEIKSAELDFYTTIKQMKDKAAKSSNLGFVDTIDNTSDEDGGEEDVTASRREEMDETNNDRSESRSRSPKKESRRESNMSAAAGRSYKEDNAADKKISVPQSPRDEANSQNLGKSTSQQKSVSTPKKSQPDNNPGGQAPQGTDAVVEKMKIQRSKQSDDED